MVRLDHLSDGRGKALSASPGTSCRSPSWRRGASVAERVKLPRRHRRLFERPRRPPSEEPREYGLGFSEYAFDGDRSLRRDCQVRVTLVLSCGWKVTKGWR